MQRSLVPFADGWEAHQNRHCIWVVSPEGYDHRTFDEVADALEDAFRELGGSAPIVRNPEEWNGRIPIVLGANLLWRLGYPPMPPNSIIFNLEQMIEGSVWMSDRYLPALQQFPVLDFSKQNLASLHGLGIRHARLLEIGYSPALAKIPISLEKPYDVIFYGSVNDRRQRIIDELVARGMITASLRGIYGPDRDLHIGRAKLVVNIHYYEQSAFEVVRVSYLVANKIPVLSERRPDETDGEWAGVEYASYDQLVERCIALVDDDRWRERLAEDGFRHFSERRQADLLRTCIAESQF
jgi:hypothetical protein